MNPGWTNNQDGHTGMVSTTTEQSRSAVGTGRRVLPFDLRKTGSRRGRREELLPVLSPEEVRVLLGRVGRCRQGRREPGAACLGNCRWDCAGWGEGWRPAPLQRQVQRAEQSGSWHLLSTWRQ